MKLQDLTPIAFPKKAYRPTVCQQVVNKVMYPVLILLGILIVIISNILTVNRPEVD